MRTITDVARLVLLAGIALALIKIVIDLEVIRYQLGG